MAVSHVGLDRLRRKNKDLAGCVQIRVRYVCTETRFWPIVCSRQRPPLAERLRASLGEVFGISFFKLLLQPAICWLLILSWFSMTHFWMEATILIAALPTGSVAFVLSQKYGIYTNGVASAILVSTALSLPIHLAILVGFATP
jgi:hypothetical protein